MGFENHVCPSCGTSLRHFARYPWHLCSACTHVATDAQGQRLEFINASAGGGLAWRRAGETGFQSDHRVICLVKGRRVVVTEAKFGGIVAQPMFSGAPRWSDGYTRDLTIRTR